MNFAIIIAMLFTQSPEQVCFASDVSKLCCPSACGAKKSPHWYQADGVLRVSMRGLGCRASESKTANLSMSCNCRGKQ